MKPVTWFERVLPGGILSTDHRHDFTNDGTCSRCRSEVPEEEVPLLLWTNGGRSMYIFCCPCLGIPREAPCAD